MESITLKISGMACGGCAASVQTALETVAGVISAEIALADAKAVVRYDPAQAPAESLCAAVAAAGYRAEIA